MLKALLHPLSEQMPMCSGPCAPGPFLSCQTMQPGIADLRGTCCQFAFCNACTSPPFVVTAACLVTAIPALFSIDHVVAAQLTEGSTQLPASCVVVPTYWLAVSANFVARFDGVCAVATIVVTGVLPVATFHPINTASPTSKTLLPSIVSSILGKLTATNPPPSASVVLGRVPASLSGG